MRGGGAENKLRSGEEVTPFLYLFSYCVDRRRRRWRPLFAHSVELYPGHLRSVVGVPGEFGARVVDLFVRLSVNLNS